MRKKLVCCGSFIVFLFVLGADCRPKGNDCRLRMSPETAIIVHSREPATFECNATCLGPLDNGQLFWRDPDGNRLPGLGPYRIHTVSYNRWMMNRLVIRRAFPEDAGLYTCEVDVDGHVMSYYAVLAVEDGVATVDEGPRRGDIYVKPDPDFGEIRPVREASLDSRRRYRSRQMKTRRLMSLENGHSDDHSDHERNTRKGVMERLEKMTDAAQVTITNNEIVKSDVYEEAKVRFLTQAANNDVREAEASVLNDDAKNGDDVRKAGIRVRRAPVDPTQPTKQFSTIEDTVQKTADNTTTKPSSFYAHPVTLPDDVSSSDMFTDDGADVMTTEGGKPTTPMYKTMGMQFTTDKADTSTPRHATGETTMYKTMGMQFTTDKANTSTSFNTTGETTVASGIVINKTLKPPVDRQSTTSAKGSGSGTIMGNRSGFPDSSSGATSGSGSGSGSAASTGSESSSASSSDGSGSGSSAGSSSGSSGAAGSSGANGGSGAQSSGDQATPNPGFVSQSKEGEEESDFGRYGVLAFCLALAVILLLLVILILCFVLPRFCKQKRLHILNLGSRDDGPKERKDKSNDNSNVILLGERPHKPLAPMSSATGLNGEYITSVDLDAASPAPEGEGKGEGKEGGKEEEGEDDKRNGTAADAKMAQGGEPDGAKPPESFVSTFMIGRLSSSKQKDEETPLVATNAPLEDNVFDAAPTSIPEKDEEDDDDDKKKNTDTSSSSSSDDEGDDSKRNSSDSSKDSDDGLQNGKANQADGTEGGLMAEIHLQIDPAGGLTVEQAQTDV